MVINPCVIGVYRAGATGLGGFVTHDLSSVIDVFFEPAFRLAPERFLTITVTEAHLPDMMPGALDPRVPARVAVGLSRYYDDNVGHGYLILLVPTTEVLLTHKDRETGFLLTDLVYSDDFLGSHVLRAAGPGGAESAKEVGSVRDNRGKAKQFTTANGRTVVVKESYVYSNKGFRNLNQAQLLTDALYYHDGLEAQQWLVYYISKPLIGTLEPIKVTIADLPQLSDTPSPLDNKNPTKASDGDPNLPNSAPEKRDIKSFNDLLNNFPMIARQMQPGLEKVFKDFNRDVEKPLPSVNPKPFSASSRRASSSLSQTTANGSTQGKIVNGHVTSPSTISVSTYAEDEEDHMRKTLETAVTAAIDLFQLVDKQQLSLLGATTELTGPLVERLIERYVTQQLHDHALFPRICDIHRLEDVELESRIYHLNHIDIAQVGIEIEGGREGKQQLAQRLSRGVEEFKKLGVAGSPQEMMDILLATVKTITTSEARPDKQIGNESFKSPLSEKPTAAMTMNADTLVSMLLIIVIRSQVRHLQARLAYMRSFIFIDDVEGGEMGYALSTFEGVLSYMTTDSGGLRVASRRNRRLWQAIKSGNISEMKAILQPEGDLLSDDEDSNSSEPGTAVLDGAETSNHFLPEATKKDGVSSPEDWRSHESISDTGDANHANDRIDNSLGASNLAHVFPFQAPEVEESSYQRPRSTKRVSMDLRSLSNGSEFSFRSRTSTMNSRSSVIEGDTSIEKLCQTQDSFGDSVLMMAVEARQPDVLEYLLSLEDYYPSHAVLEDCNGEGTSLLSAAVQLAHGGIIEILTDYILRIRDVKQIQNYLSKQDSRGRTVAHHLFNAPQLIQRFGTLLPWRIKDKNGQTPLLAVCRSYDHPKYMDMVNHALQSAMDEQNDYSRLHLDNHIDGKGNSLLHVVNDPYLALRILQHCDADPNATNDKRFTPLMVASKFGRFDMVRAMFLDKRVDVQAKEQRGMTAVELAKDDEVRNRIDDMILVSNTPAADGRVTAVVRSFFVEDATVRLIIKTAARSGEGMIAVTTCRRSLTDFENLAKWLSVEHPASWLPSILNLRSPFQIPSRPSRAVLHDIQVRLDKFLSIMLAHSTFSTHELLWEFILVPEIQPEMMGERSTKKAEIRAENVKDEYEPVEDVRDVESFVGHARESIRGVNHSSKSVIRRVNSIRNASSDFSTSLDLAAKSLSTLAFLPQSHISAFIRYAATTTPFESDPFKLFHQDLQAVSSTILAILSSLSRPQTLIASLQATQKAIDRHKGSLRRSDRWPLGLLDETRKGIHLDAQERMEKSQEELRTIGCELRYTQQTVAGELAGWQDLHGRMARRAIRRLAAGMVVREKDRLEGMKRAVRGLLGDKGV
ncbi:hypothetical protein MMC11_003027 [Xylographa trunciseda]|nr:hypothetical protein [Xylographa trunciseda]